MFDCRQSVFSFVIVIHIYISTCVLYCWVLYRLFYLSCYFLCLYWLISLNPRKHLEFSHFLYGYVFVYLLLLTALCISRLRIYLPSSVSIIICNFCYHLLSSFPLSSFVLFETISPNCALLSWQWSFLFSFFGTVLDFS